MKKADIFFFSKKGGDTARRIRDALAGREYACRLLAPQRLALGETEKITGGIGKATGERFFDTDALIYVGACGIAVRAIAPHIKSKTTDLPVLCVDEAGKFATPLLSGHVGGGNALARLLAGEIGAQLVVTTATDGNGRFSVDAWAVENGYRIHSMGAAKRFSAAILERELPFVADAPVMGRLPEGLFQGGEGDLGLYISYKTASPFSDTLRLIPRCLVLGIGCRRGTASEAVANAVKQVLGENAIDPLAVAQAASVTLKSEEAGILRFCESMGLPISFYTPDALMGVAGEFTPSEFVMSTVGADNICERAAATGGNEIIVRKTAVNGVTIAVGRKKWEVCFE